MYAVYVWVRSLEDVKRTTNEDDHDHDHDQNCQVCNERRSWNASIKIQASWRGAIARGKSQRRKKAIVTIQRVWRGHQIRQRVAILRVGVPIYRFGRSTARMLGKITPVPESIRQWVHHADEHYGITVQMWIGRKIEAALAV